MKRLLFYVAVIVAPIILGVAVYTAFTIAVDAWAVDTSRTSVSDSYD